MSNKINIEQELGELIYRFKNLKKALAEEEQNLTPMQKLAAEYAKHFKGVVPTKEQLVKKAREINEQKQAQNLANQLQKAGILGNRPPPRQPTSDEQRMAAQNMYAQANGFSTQEEMRKAEDNWGTGVINNWLAEATKPINQRFSSPEEEQAYWDSIKVNDSGKGNGGY